MRTAEVVIINPSGLHARPGAHFRNLATTWQSKIRVENLTRSVGPVDATSILGILKLGAGKGHRLSLSVEGPDEDEAIAALVASIESGLGEPIEGSATAEAPAAATD
jgi:phosphoenolpyruvate---glycerone phosphotransferase subunit DhaM